MSVNITYQLSGTGLSLTYETEHESVELTLDDSYSPFDGTHQLSGQDVVKQPTDAGFRLAGTLTHDSVGRGGPIHKTRSFTLFLAESPEPADSAVEQDVTGAVVFADPQPGFGAAAPAYRAESLTGTLSVPALEPPGRF